MGEGVIDQHDRFWRGEGDTRQSGRQTFGCVEVITLGAARRLVDEAGEGAVEPDAAGDRRRHEFAEAGHPVFERSTQFLVDHAALRKVRSSRRQAPSACRRRPLSVR